MRLLNEGCNPRESSTDALSFIGDAVYSLLVREKLCCIGGCRSDSLHKSSARFVNAAAQATAYKIISDVLTDEEDAVFKRGRNSHNNHVPKSQSVADYHAATGLEALFGYLYLKGDSERIQQLFSLISSKQGISSEQNLFTQEAVTK